MDSLITAVILLIISGIAALLKKKAQSDETANPPPVNRPGQPRPASTPRPQRRAATSWEEELRRLLEGEPPLAPPPMRPPPPVVAVPSPRPAPAPFIPPPRPALEPRVAPIPVPSVEISAGRLAPLDESRQAYERASQLDTTTSSRIARVPGEHVQLTTVVRKPMSAEAIQVIALFKTARTARQAVLDSIILGPPKALEQTPTLF